MVERGPASLTFAGQRCDVWIVNDDLLKEHKMDYDIAWRHERGHCNGFKQQIRAAFYVDTPSWKAAVHGRFADFVLGSRSRGSLFIFRSSPAVAPPHVLIASLNVVLNVRLELKVLSVV